MACKERIYFGGTVVFHFSVFVFFIVENNVINTVIRLHIQLSSVLK